MAWHSFTNLSHFNQPGTPPLPVDWVMDVRGLLPDHSLVEEESRKPSREAKAGAVGSGRLNAKPRSTAMEGCVDTFCMSRKA